MTDDVTNLETFLATIDDLWAPRIVARVNDWAIKAARVRGEYVWHAHQDTDEVFVVLSGELQIARRGRAPVVLGPGDVHVVRRGVEHRPSSADGAEILMIEPAATLSTGDYAGAVPGHITATTGLVG